MSKYYILSFLLFSILLVFSCGVNDPSINSEIEDVENETATLEKRGIPYFPNSDLLGLTPMRDKIKVETISATNSKIVTKISGLEDVVISTKYLKLKYYIVGSEISIIVEQDVNGGIRSIPRILSISGNAGYAGVSGNSYASWLNTSLSKTTEGEGECVNDDDCEPLNFPPMRAECEGGVCRYISL